MAKHMTHKLTMGCRRNSDRWKKELEFISRGNNEWNIVIRVPWAQTLLHVNLDDSDIDDIIHFLIEHRQERPEHG